MDMIENFLGRLAEILSTVWGWLLFAAMVLADYVSGYGMMVDIAVTAVVMDAVWGIASSLKQGNFALSELARDTLAKLAVYGCAVLSFIGIDRMLGVDSGLTTSIICSCIVLVELWSASASMLICFPHMPFLQLLKKALVGEIARKLNIEPEDVEETLNKIKKNEKHKVHSGALHGGKPESDSERP